MRELRIGLVGTSRGRQLADAGHEIAGVRFTAVFDLDRARAEQTALALSARAFDEYTALLAADVDAVFVASSIPAHATQVEAALAAGKHVLCEVTPCLTMPEARRLVDAVRAAGATYMLAENYRYFGEVELIRRLHAQGRFGEVYYAESDQLIDIRKLWRDEDGRLTWRGRGEVGVYSTHNLGPLLTILDDRVASVSALTVPGGKFDPEVVQPTMHLLQMQTVGGVAIRVRIDLASPRPPLGAYYALQGTAGCYESWRGLGDACKIWLADEHGPSEFHAWGEWRPLADLASRYLADWGVSVPGTEGADRRMIEAFVAAVRGEVPSPIDACRGLDFTLPGILAEESAARGGAPVAVPDPRAW